MITETSENIKRNNRPYPKLMISDSGMIVLFIRERAGTVLHSSGLKSMEGRYDTEWPMRYYRDFEGELTMKNG